MSLDEGDDFEGGTGLSEPQWGSVLDLHSRARQGAQQAIKPVGDPLKWGGTSRVLLTPDAAIPVNVVTTPEFVRMQAIDTYSRSWSLLGSLELPVATWAAFDAGVTFVVPFLEISQGVGQTTLVQALKINELTVIGAAVYQPVFNVQYFAGGTPTREARSFAAIGALVGRAISMRMIYLFAGAGVAGLPGEAVMNVIVTPYAPGYGL